MKKLFAPRIIGGFFSSGIKIASLLLLFLAMQGCAEPDGIGLDLIDQRANFYTTDTISLQAYSVTDEHIPTNTGSQNLLGVMHDPVFGKVRAGIFTEVRLPMNNLSLGEDPILDSIRLSLAYSGRFYGNLETLQTLRVYELSENIPDSDTLYSDTFINHYPDPVGVLSLYPAPREPVVIDTVDLPPHFVIPLSTEFGEKILAANNTPYFENIPNFLDYFKGFYIEAEDIEQNGAIFNLNMLSQYTVMQLYYHNPGDTVSTLQNFFISDFARRITYVDHFGFENAHPLLQAQVIEQQTESGDSLLFVQGLGGLRVNIEMPFLSDLERLTDVAINQAQLMVYVEPTLVGEPIAEEPGRLPHPFPVADRLLLMRYDDEGEMQFLSDFTIGSTYFGGAYQADKKRYVFNITSYIQQVLNGEIPNNGLVLVISGAAESAQRVVLKGPGRTSNPMRLELIYTVFE